MSKGVLIFAYSNEEIDYLKMAVVSAKSISHHLNVPVSLVTNNTTIEVFEKDCNENLHEVFDQIIKIEEFHSCYSRKRYRDGFGKKKNLPFYNKGRTFSYDLTPYDETVVIDSDYIVQCDVLNQCWGSVNDIMMNCKNVDIRKDRNSFSNRVSVTGIPLYWATVFYFKKNQQTGYFFDLLKEVENSYNFYSKYYGFDSSLYRNDFVFSIAAHIYIGSQEDNKFPSLPNSKMFSSSDLDDIIDVGKDYITFSTTKTKDENGTGCLVRVQDADVHVMNKWSITRNFNKFVDNYEK